jgi:hypothetical protein
MWKLVFGGWCRHIYAYWLQFSEFLEINSPVKSKSALATSGNWKKKNTDNNPAFRTVLTWQRVQLTPTRQRSALKSRPRSCEMTFRGQTYRHQSGRDLRVKTRVSTPQIDEFGGRLAYYFNAAPLSCALWNPAQELCVLLCLQQLLSCRTTGALVLYITEKFRFRVVNTRDLARGSSHHVQVALRQGLTWLLIVN